MEIASFLPSILYPGEILFGVTMIFFASALTVSFLMGQQASLVRVLTGLLTVILFLLFGTVAIEFSAAQTPSFTYGTFASLSEALSTHRWLLFQLPILLTMTSLIVLSTYHEHLMKAHARMYRAVVQISVAISFASMLVISVESFI